MRTWTPAPYPRPGAEGVPEPTGWRVWLPLALIPVGILVGVATIAVLGLALLKAVDPMGDEWVCSPGERPTLDGAGGGQCLKPGQPLPPGNHLDPLGNRPMPYNCDKAGWTQIENRRGVQDCLNDDLPMPAGWHAVE